MVEEVHVPYPVPAGRFRAAIERGRSNFVATLDRTATVELAREFVLAIRREFPEANHHVYAFVVGFPPSVIQGAGDDGEPAGTAGPPTLRVLEGAGIGDACIVTARIFGGVKLGAGGLVRAYTDAAKAVLAVATTVEKRAWVYRSLEVPYALADQVQRMLAEPLVVVEERTYGALVRFDVRIDAAHEGALRAALADASAGLLALADRPAPGS
jgi:uncharacterized YigZ family protein